MDKVIGLGTMGCGIAEEFTAYPEYRVYKIGTNLASRGNLIVAPQKDMAAYEVATDTDEVVGYLRSIRKGDEVLFIVAGSEPIAGMSLAILEQIKDASVTVLYVAPDAEVSSDEQIANHRIVSGVLQEYARSGVFRRIFLTSRSILEEIVGDVAIRDHEKKINNFISYITTMINYCDHIDPVISNKEDPALTSRIGTFGISSLEVDADIVYLYNLTAAQDIHHYYAIPASDLDEKVGLLRDIKTRIRRFTSADINTSFSVYSTTFADPVVLVTAFSEDIQL